MGEHAGQLASRQLLDGERRDDDEVSAAGEGVELVEGEDAQDVALGGEIVRPGEAAATAASIIRSSCRRRPARAEQRREHDRLDRPDEQQHRGDAVADGEHPEREVPGEAQQRAR